VGAGCSPRNARDAMPLREFVAALSADNPMRISGTAIFMTRNLEHVPLALLHALKHYKVLHKRVVMMQVETEDVPHVPEEQRLEIGELGKGFYTIRLRYGFMDQPNVVRALAQCRIGGLRFNLMETSFVIGREKLRARPRRTAFWRWRDRLFIPMSNNTLDATEFFRIAWSSSAAKSRSECGAVPLVGARTLYILYAAAAYRHRILISFAITVGLCRWTAAVNVLPRPRVSLSSRCHRLFGKAPRPVPQG
jgi:hypothetical protein